MKIINIMNFVRYIDERKENSIEPMYETTKGELALVNELKLPNTFLLQYDAVCDEKYQRLFKQEATERTELGLWYEIVRPLCDACDIPFNSEYGWSWDWHIVPGFSMAYTPKQRERLADEAMRKFREVFGYYPKTVASWLIDTHTVNYLADRYDISAFAICRDQVSTDAYTLIGGYFNGAYYPSRNNMFTPAQSDALRVNVPMFRLLGPCPIHNYEAKKYLSPEQKPLHQCFTLEPVYGPGGRSESVDWFFRTYFENEDLGFSYAQLGQENSFGCSHDLVTPLRMQFEKLPALKGVAVEKMCDTGERFKRAFPGKTPATALVALDNWDTEDLQSAWYDCENYTANICRFEDATFLRALFLFDERVPEAYLEKTCTTFDAVYENLPIIDNLSWHPDEKKRCGLILDESAAPFRAERTADGELTVLWGEKRVIFTERGIVLDLGVTTLSLGTPSAKITVTDGAILYEYKGTAYALIVEGGSLCENSDGTVTVSPLQRTVTLVPTRG